MDTLIQDLKYAVRTLRRTPAFTLAAVTCLALGIGANTAIFSVIDGVLLRPLPFKDPGSLVMVWETNRSHGEDRNVVSPANYLDWRAQNSTFSEIGSYIDARIAEHRANPQDDLTSFLIDAEIDGQHLEPDHIVGTMVLLMIAGIDTTWSAIGASLWHLASHPEDRKRLVAEPELLPTAVEEFLRFYGPVTMARMVSEDFEFEGAGGACPMREGDWLLLPFPAANRDPAHFPDADTFVIDRAENRHSAFGLGIHRCLGSNLARLELRVAIEEWLARFPDFELADPAAVTWSVGQVRGPRTLPLRILAADDREAQVS